MPDTAPLKAISLKLEPELLERIKSEAAARGTNVSAFIRGCVLSCLPGSSADASLTEQIQQTVVSLESRKNSVFIASRGK